MIKGMTEIITSRLSATGAWGYEFYDAGRNRMIAYIGTGAVVLGDVNWLAALSAGAFGFVLAILLALTGLPEVEQDEGK